MIESEPNCFAKPPPSAISLNGVPNPLADHEAAACSTAFITNRIQRHQRRTPTAPIASSSLELIGLAEAIGALHDAETENREP